MKQQILLVPDRTIRKQRRINALTAVLGNRTQAAIGGGTQVFRKEG